MSNAIEPTKQTRSVVGRDEFYQGLMLALRLKTDHFVAEGPAFHQAFVKVLDFIRSTASSYEVEDIDWIRVDPVFGVVHEANEMLLEAEQDHLVALLNPRLRVAQFKISEEQAAEELAQTDAPDWFRTLAETFHQELARAR